MTDPGLYALVLAGGASKRMHRDKATLDYGGGYQLDRTVALARRHAAAAFVSVRADQANDPVRARHTLIVDAFSDVGPIAGIRSALRHSSRHPWLVLACDLPFLSDDTIAHLVRSRDPSCFATAYRSAYDGLPEPLCAIWEPKSAEALAQWQAQGHTCPRKFLAAHAVTLLEPIDEHALDNVNTPEEYAVAHAALHAGGAPARMKIEIQYYALLREQAGTSAEAIDTSAQTPAYRSRAPGAPHPLTLPHERVTGAVNGEFTDWARGLRSGDIVVFIPPVAGG